MSPHLSPQFVSLPNIPYSGPFGGVIPVQMAQAGAAPAAAAGSNSTVAAATANKRQIPADEPDCDDDEDASSDAPASLPLGRRASEIAAEAWAKMKLKRSRVGGWN